MNAIEFRAWDKNSDDWFYFNLVPFFFDYRYTGEAFKNIFHGKNIDHNKINQYTGSKDMNGKMIYKDDILAFNNGYSDVVRFERGAWRWNKRNGVLFNFKPEKNLCIIGNIHQNPELIKKILKTSEYKLVN